jgi:hypothetical protein
MRKSTKAFSCFNPSQSTLCNFTHLAFVDDPTQVFCSDERWAAAGLPGTATQPRGGGPATQQLHCPLLPATQHRDSKVGPAA